MVTADADIAAAVEGAMTAKFRGGGRACTAEELLDWINDTEYGLAAYVYSGRLQDVPRIGESNDAGMVGINRGIVSDPSAPFGGTKQSGLGREGGRDGMREFQETQYFSVDFA